MNVGMASYQADGAVQGTVEIVSMTLMTKKTNITSLVGKALESAWLSAPTSTLLSWMLQLLSMMGSASAALAALV
ncbi:unnamed protein product [Sphenostylis stenocarpa]|uniref:Uncharacterized protein n=1 Tax=Sphenostylis stenocarpa TaxID=92480 RepID=A0AA86W634_9FABA|nr:unnamed protein product [Sphenostylis stenocarpa]